MLHMDLRAPSRLEGIIMRHAPHHHPPLGPGPRPRIAQAEADEQLEHHGQPKLHPKPAEPGRVAGLVRRVRALAARTT